MTSTSGAGTAPRPGMRQRGSRAGTALPWWLDWATVRGAALIGAGLIVMAGPHEEALLVSPFGIVVSMGLRRTGEGGDAHAKAIHFDHRTAPGLSNDRLVGTNSQITSRPDHIAGGTLVSIVLAAVALFVLMGFAALPPDQDHRTHLRRAMGVFGVGAPVILLSGPAVPDNTDELVTKLTERLGHHPEVAIRLTPSTITELD